MGDTMKAEAAASIVADLVMHLGVRPDLILEDPLGDFHHRFYFELPCTDQVMAVMSAKGFAHVQRERTPHNPEVDTFLSNECSASVHFSDPAKNPHITLWPGPPPEQTEAARWLEKILRDRGFVRC